MTKSLMWLASYPKSGNTWMRAFLANYIFDLDQPVPVNQLSRLGIGDANTLAHRRVAGGRFDVTNPRETVRIRRKMLDTIDGNGADLNLIKTHNQNTKAFGTDLVPRHQTKGAIYIVRDPRDMAVSYASHHGMTLDETVERLGPSGKRDRGQRPKRSPVPGNLVGSRSQLDPRPGVCGADSSLRGHADRCAPGLRRDRRVSEARLRPGTP